MNDYEEHQRNRDREYLEAWKNLSAEQRRELEKAGIRGPAMPVYRTGKPDTDAALECATQPQSEAEAASIGGDDNASVARIILGELLSQDNVRLTAECMALVTGLTYDGNSMTQTAKRHGVTRAAVSKRCVDIADALGLPPARAMKQLTARKTYERRARKCHSRDGH